MPRPRHQEARTSSGAESPGIYGEDSLYLAKYLNISKFAQGQLTAGSSRGGSASAKGTKITYKIKSGDILGRIAARYHVTVKQLMSWNNIKNAKTLRPGQTLVIYRK